MHWPQKSIATIGVLLTIFALSCSAVPSPRDISISIHIDDQDQQIRGDLHPQEESDVTLNFDDLPGGQINDPDGGRFENYNGLKFTGFRAINAPLFASSQPNVALADSDSEGPRNVPMFETLPDSPERSFDLHGLVISPTRVSLIWPPEEFTLTVRAWPVDDDEDVIFQEHRIGGVDGSRYPANISFVDVARVSSVEIFLLGGFHNRVAFFLDDLKIGWRNPSPNGPNAKQAILSAEKYGI